MQQAAVRPLTEVTDLTFDQQAKHVQQHRTYRKKPQRRSNQTPSEATESQLKACVKDSTLWLLSSCPGLEAGSSTLQLLCSLLRLWKPHLRKKPLCNHQNSPNCMRTKPHTALTTCKYSATSPLTCFTPPREGVTGTHTFEKEAELLLSIRCDKKGLLICATCIKIRSW